MVKGTQPNAHEEEKRTLEEKEERKKQEKNFEKTKEFITTLENLKKYSFQKEEEINELLSFQEKIKEEGLDIAHVEGNPHDSEEKQIKERVESFKKILLFPSKLNEIEGFIKLDIKSLEETIEDKEERNRERERLFKSSRAILDTNTLIKNEIEKNAIAHPMEIQKIFEDAIKSINPELFNTSFLTELSMLGDVFLTKDNRKNFLENSVVHRRKPNAEKMTSKAARIFKKIGKISLPDDLKEISNEQAMALEKQGKGVLVRKTKNKCYLLDNDTDSDVGRIIISKRTKVSEENN
jgi:hypothetical protein